MNKGTPWPEDIDIEVWSLCLGENGVILRNPNEILDGWTLEQVWDAHELFLMHAKAREKYQKDTEIARQVAKSQSRRARRKR